MANEVLVETYEIEEAEWAGDEMDKDAYLKLAEECGLEGQKQIFVKEGTIPFQRLSENEKRVWEAYCPGRFKAKEYKETVIPMRVLGLIKVCTERQYFQRIEIWTEHENNPDPIVIGIVGNNDYNTKAVYLIARWGQSLESWPLVVKSASEKWMAASKAKLEKTVAEANMNLAALGDLARRHFAGEYVGI